MKEDEMSGVCRAHGGRSEIRTKFWLERLGRDHSEDLGLDGRIILKLIFGN
jgi:hypothetical protein